MKIGLVAMVAALLFPAAAMAQENPGEGFWRYDRNQIYGQGLMTPEERQSYRRQLWELRTDAERERFRDRHQQKMQERARRMGVPNPEEIAPYGWREPAPPGEEDGWPEDGLRRWPAERQSADGLRRLPEEAPAWSSAKGVRNLARPPEAGTEPSSAESWTTHGGAGWGVAERAETRNQMRQFGSEEAPVLGRPR